MPRRSRFAVALGLALALVACGDTDPQGFDPDQSETDVLDPSPTDEMDGGAAGDGAPSGDDGEESDMPDNGEPEEVAVRDAAERAGVAPGEVTVVTNEQVTWPDGALGCPQDGQFYTQALVEGYRIIVEADGEMLHYHGQAGAPPAYCANPQEPASGGQTGTVDR